ncbi:hypothetical protein BLNAU_4125 [Blattamonas nauphoetae]|uniref:Uncharacterized protein n=1 Tax=Blattamonas nauphoetae TaxID=2049346 RepID=A0ABQ9YB85_9EUKA|nr:hypothetical protein BLNAU_4125 [Blattamonas nauphoetae]
MERNSDPTSTHSSNTLTYVTTEHPSPALDTHPSQKTANSPLSTMSSNKSEDFLHLPHSVVSVAEEAPPAGRSPALSSASRTTRLSEMAFDERQQEIVYRRQETRDRIFLSEAEQAKQDVQFKPKITKRAKGMTRSDMVNQTIAQILSVFRNRLPTYAILSQSQKKQTPIDSSLRFAFRRNQTYLSNLVVHDNSQSPFSSRFAWSQSVQAKRKNLQKAIDCSEQAQCSFSPILSKKANSLTPTSPPSERLYADAINRREKEGLKRTEINVMIDEGMVSFVAQPANTQKKPFVPVLRRKDAMFKDLLNRTNQELAFEEEQMKKAALTGKASDDPAAHPSETSVLSNMNPNELTEFLRGPPQDMRPDVLPSPTSPSNNRESSTVVKTLSQSPAKGSPSPKHNPKRPSTSKVIQKTETSTDVVISDSFDDDEAMQQFRAEERRKAQMRLDEAYDEIKTASERKHNVYDLEAIELDRIRRNIRSEDANITQKQKENEGCLFHPVLQTSPSTRTKLPKKR